MSDGDENHKTMLGISPFRVEDGADEEGEASATHPKSVEERLAAQRKAMALRTRPMQALTDLDWDLPGLGDASAPTPDASLTPKAPAPPVVDNEPPSSDAPDTGPLQSRAPGTPEVEPSEDGDDGDGPTTMLTPMPRVDDEPARSGTIRMSAAEIAGITGDADRDGDAPAEPAADASAPDDDAADEALRGGTMMMSAAALQAAVGDAAMAPALAGGPTADEPVAGPTGDVAAAEAGDVDAGDAEADEPHAAGGTMLMSADAVAAMADGAGDSLDETDDDTDAVAGGTMLMSADAVAAMADGAGDDADRGHHAASGSTLTDTRVELPERHVARRPDTPSATDEVADDAEADPFAERRNYRTGPTTLQSAIDTSVPPPARPEAGGNELERVADAIRPAPSDEPETTTSSSPWMWIAVAVVVIAVAAFVAWSMFGS